MIRAVFIGSRNEFDEMIVDWLAKRVNLVGVVWTKSTAWSQTWNGRLRFFQKRLQRHGILKAIDETLFYLYYHSILSRKDQADLKEFIIDRYWKQNETSNWNGDSIFTMDVNSEEVRSFLHQRKPDIALAMCIKNYFGKGLREIPKHGVFLWHEGITPEYRGLYSPFWAVSNLDFSRVGYTLLRMNDDYDAGEVFAQGRASEIDPWRQSHGYLGHKAIADSFGDVEKLLGQIEAGTAKPLSKNRDALDGFYTYPGLTDLIRQRIRLRRHFRSSNNQVQG